MLQLRWTDLSLHPDVWQSKQSARRIAELPHCPRVQDVEIESRKILRVAGRKHQPMVRGNGGDLQIDRRARALVLAARATSTPHRQATSASNERIRPWNCATTTSPSHFSSARRRAVDSRRRMPATSSPSVIADFEPSQHGG